MPDRIPEMEENSVSLEKELPKSHNLLVPDFRDLERCSSEQRPPYCAIYDMERPPYPHQVVADSNILVGEQINIVDTDQPVSKNKRQVFFSLYFAIITVLPI